MSVVLSGECKDHKGNLSIKTMAEILENVPKTSKVHLVFTNRLQGGYYTMNKDKEWFQKFIKLPGNEKLDHTAILRLEEKDGKMEFLEIKGLVTKAHRVFKHKNQAPPPNLILFVPYLHVLKINKQICK
jgi:hypothetical protein